MLIFDERHFKKGELKEIELESFKQYRKKTLIRARQLDQDFIVKTREGDMLAHAGDYLAIGVEGELYPIQKEIFMKTYELVE